MISFGRQDQFRAYGEARRYFLANVAQLIALEQALMNAVVKLLRDHLAEIRRDFNEASYLHAFWQNYPPKDRGRDPLGDQYPWIEVGEHAIGAKLPRLLPTQFELRDTGFPTGPDQRFVVASRVLSTATGGYSNSAWLCVDVKSVGPRDDPDANPHAVMSHNQVSGDGRWETENAGLMNSVMVAKGKVASHAFHASLPPILVLSDGTIAPTVSLVVKPRYEMLLDGSSKKNRGQPLARLTVAAIPNGLLLSAGPNYLKRHPALLYPGKDDKSKDPTKLRARISFELLAIIAPWRVLVIDVPEPDR